MKKIIFCVFTIATLIFCSSQSHAYSTSTASRQALMSGVGSGLAQQHSSSKDAQAAATSSGASQAGSVTPATAGITAQGSGQNINALYPQNGRPSASTLNAGTAAYRPVLRQTVSMQAPPAWAQSSYPAPLVEGLQPYGASLFLGNFANTYQEGLQPQYVITPGDRIMLRAWGAFTYDDILVVDQQGNVFVPEVGPITVGGLTNAQLQSTIQSQIASVFTSNVQIYTNLMSSQPVAVFVTGHVTTPGRYAGGQHDSILYYLDRAGGIVPERGSFRHVVVKRGKKVVANVDLYDFLTNGDLPGVQLQDGDVILVRNRGIGIAATGLIRQPAFYEFDPGKVSGTNLLAVAWPLPSASHVSVSGTRKGADFHTYMTMTEFRSFRLQDEDIVEFHADTPGDTIMVGATGAIMGNSRFPVRKGTTLRQLLQYVQIDPSLASIEAVYLRRQSVAAQQKKTIHDALVRLEQRALTATSNSVDEAEIRIKEAELIQDFVRRADVIEPDGVVVVCRKGQINDLVLEEGDIVYVPQKSGVVQITGEVTIPKAIVWNEDLKLKDYVCSAGGYTDRADPDSTLVLKPNGEVGPIASLGVGPGDQIMVLPSYDSKVVQSIKDIVQIVYQLAVSAGVVLIPLWS